jgi:nitrous oxidase accessory protein
MVVPGDSIIKALSRAAPGDTIHLKPGTFAGGLVVDVPGLTIEGEPGAVLQGSGAGDAIRINAPDVAIRGLTIRGSGLTLIDKNSGIFLDRTAHRGHIENNRLEDNLIGIYVDGPHDVVVRGNHIQGLRRLRRTERGPAISLWNTPGSMVLDNDIRSGRDGVFSVSSKRNVVRGNSFHDLRFAVHFMYTNDSEVADNLSVGNEVGYVLMYSDRLRVQGNVSDRDRDNGLLFNFANASNIEGNLAQGSNKCVFIYNANKNRFTGNWFEGCQIGIHFTAGSERNEISSNAFVNNRTQVMYVGTRLLDWSVRGRGNYYTDNPAFDLNGDGIADTAYRPNDLMDQVIWRAPSAKLLLNSPAVQVVRWAQSQFPAIHPGGVIDTAPLMAPPHPSALARLAPQ